MVVSSLRVAQDRVTPRVSADAAVAIATSVAAAVIVNFMVASSLRVAQDRVAPRFDRDVDS